MESSIGCQKTPAKLWLSPTCQNIMPAPILIIAIGNESRGDDALAPLLLRRLETERHNGQFELLEDFQLQVEHAADIAERELVLFIDAGMNTPAPYSFYRAQPDGTHTAFSHALAPEAVLATHVQVYQQNPPPAFVLCIRGEKFELGSALSPEASQNMKSALALLRKLLHETNVAAWEFHAQAVT
jgi:hydrogenase maturation protease